MRHSASVRRYVIETPVFDIFRRLAGHWFASDAFGSGLRRYCARQSEIAGRARDEHRVSGCTADVRGNPADPRFLDSRRRNFGSGD